MRLIVVDHHGQLAMASLRLFGVEPGCDTVRAIKAIREGAGLRLNEALAIVNRVLGKEEVFVSAATLDQAHELPNRLTKIGMVVEVVAG